MARKPAPKRSVLILARTITGVVSLILAEGMLWMLGYPNWRVPAPAPSNVKSEYDPDPELGWKNSEGEYLMSAPDRTPFRYTNWSQGRRATSEHAPAEAQRAEDAKPRVAYVGDSYVYGYGLGDTDTFAWRIQQRHPEVQVNNYGTPGYGTYQSYIAMKRALNSRVVIGGSVSVFYMLNGFHEARNVADPSWIRIPALSENGTFFPFVVLTGGVLEVRRSDGDRIWALSQKLRTVAMAEEYYEMGEAWKRVHQKRAVTQALLVQMDHLAQVANAKFTVIVFDLYPQDRQVYRQFLQSRKIAFIDCDHSQLNDKSLRQSDGHPTAKLDELISEWIDPAATTALVGAR